MELIIFIGLQATGKSSFYRTGFDRTHVRINLDMLKTRHRERRLLETCLEIRQACVIDNTNPSRADRARYIEPARAMGFSIIGYYFQSMLSEALVRNAARSAAERIPDQGLRGSLGRLERPSYAEGFTRLHYVHFDGCGGFQVEDWRDDL
jgi:predicted kinase